MFYDIDAMHGKCPCYVKTDLCFYTRSNCRLASVSDEEQLGSICSHQDNVERLKTKYEPYLVNLQSFDVCGETFDNIQAIVYSGGKGSVAHDFDHYFNQDPSSGGDYGSMQDLMVSLTTFKPVHGKRVKTPFGESFLDLLKGKEFTKDVERYVPDRGAYVERVCIKPPVACVIYLVKSKTTLETSDQLSREFLMYFGDSSIMTEVYKKHHMMHQPGLGRRVSIF